MVVLNIFVFVIYAKLLRDQFQCLVLCTLKSSHTQYIHRQWCPEPECAIGLVVKMFLILIKQTITTANSEIYIFFFFFNCSVGRVLV